MVMFDDPNNPPPPSPPLPPPQITNPAQTPNPGAPGVPWTAPLTPAPWTAPLTPPPHPHNDLDTNALPQDMIGDIPPPPVPLPPKTTGPGVGGIIGTEAGTLSMPGTRGAAPFHSTAFTNPRPPRFGPGVPTTGGSGLGVDPKKIAELLQALAAQGGQP